MEELEIRGLRPGEEGQMDDLLEREGVGHADESET